LTPIVAVAITCIDPWVLEFMVSNTTYRQQSMGKLYFVGFLFLWFKCTTKSVKIRTTEAKCQWGHFKSSVWVEILL
jgi:hypothetical protein